MIWQLNENIIANSSLKIKCFSKNNNSHRFSASTFLHRTDAKQLLIPSRPLLAPWLFIDDIVCIKPAKISKFQASGTDWRCPLAPDWLHIESLKCKSSCIEDCQLICRAEFMEYLLLVGFVILLLSFLIYLIKRMLASATVYRLRKQL